MKTDCLNVMIIERDEKLAQKLERGFSKQGFVVTCCQNTDEALEHFQAQPYIALISEVYPQGTIAELTEFLKIAEQQKSQIVVVVGIAQERNTPLTGVFEAGVDAVFWKPYESITIEELVKMSVIPHLKKQTRRRFSRMQVQSKVSAALSFESRILRVNLDNISQGGMLVSTQDKNIPEIGKKISFVVTSEKTGDHISGVGTIAWIKGESTTLKIGISFILEECEKEKIFSFVNKQKTLLFAED